MRPPCPKCKAGPANIYFQDGEYVCIICGKHFPRSFIKSSVPPETNVKTEEKIMTEQKAENNPTPRVCRNCRRPKTIQMDGLCGGCNATVYKKFTKGTPEYDAALASAKAHFTDPNYKRGSKCQKITIKNTDIATHEHEQEKSENHRISEKINHKNTIDPPTEMIVRGSSPLRGVFAGLSLAVDKLRAERDCCLTMVEKIDQAIAILES
jgi:hypothetical protein